MNSTDPAAKFARFNLSREDEAAALQVSDLFLMYLKNKISDYASAVVDQKLPYHVDPKLQVEAILALEKLKNFVEAYEELMGEIIQALPQPFPSNQE